MCLCTDAFGSWKLMLTVIPLQMPFTFSVITKDFPPYTVAAGNPAKPIKQYDASSKEWVRV
jgi:hypothetical protein